ncbi:MAG: lysine exporter LysO family protein [Bacteroidales bacterium]|nr:lysine exporter LysO family protein [Bacteroidales bacterium]MBR0354094.1 lysine exporter LysO family protein [Oscillospiraceae bacterium]
MIVTIGILLAGFLLGLLLKGRVKLPTSAITMASICLLLFILGLEIGGNDELLANLPTMGLTALIVTVLAVLGSVVLARLFTKKEEMAGGTAQATEASGAGTPPAEAPPAETPAGGLRDSLIIVGCFVAGVLVALAGWLPEGLPMGQITTWGLYVLLVCVGFGLGMDEGFFASLKTLPLRSLLLPLVTIVGSLAGGLLAWWIVSLMHTTAPGLADTLAVTSGFGYYSLSSVLLDEARGAMIATIALASNLLRELMTLLTAPLLRRWFGPYAVISSGGATSMDTTLPVAVRYGGSRYAPVSIYHGFFLTVAVPFIVSFFISYA